jgi:hypothetical protein
MAARHQQIAYGLIGLGLALAIIPIVNGFMYKSGSLTTLSWGIALSLLVLTVGIVYAIPPLPEAPRRNEPNYLRVVLLIVLGGAGLLTAIYGVSLALSGPPFFAVKDYREVFAGGIKKWRDPANGYENAWAIFRVAAAVVVGLVLMFAGLQLARTFERTSQGLRRLLYGYNAVLSSLLIGFILLLLNVMSYSNVAPFKALGTTYDWTGAKMYSLSESTENVLTNLKEPVTVYLLMSSRSPTSVDAEALLNTCRQHTDQLSWESLSPEGNIKQVIQLAEKYRLSDPRGMLVVYGREGSQTWEFTPENELRVPDPKNPGGLGYIFKGEEYLQKALISLTQNKTKTVVYFTQGHGEPELTAQDGGPRRDGLGVLADKLRERSYDVRELKLGAGVREVPGDADIVVVVDPRGGYSGEEVSALRDYLQGKGASGKKGHLVLLSDVHVKGGRMVHTGLEGLLAEFGVKLEDDRLLFVGGAERDILNVHGLTNPQSNNPVARAFFPQVAREPTEFLFEGPRSVEKINQPGGGFVVDTLVLAPWYQRVIRQTDLSESPEGMIRDLKQNPEKARNMLLQVSPTLAMAVSEGSPLSRIPGHENLGGGGEKPRLVVFGAAGWVSSSALGRTGQLGQDRIDLFASCLAWLRERSDIGANVTTHDRAYYRLNMPPGMARIRLLLLPLSLLLVAVLAMGLGVWVVRRR